MTRHELGGSLWAAIHGQRGERARGRSRARQRVFRAVHLAISHGLVRSCHDLSEGGLAVALAEMAMAGGLGAGRLAARRPLRGRRGRTTSCSCSPNRPAGSCSRFLPEHHAALADLVGSLPLGPAGRGRFASPPGRQPRPRRLTVTGLDGSVVIEAPIGDLKAAWQRPLRW